MALSIRHLASNDNEIWDHLVNSSPQGHVLLLSFFLSAWIENDPEIHLLRLGCFDHQGYLVGGQAFLHKKKVGIIRVQTNLQTWQYIDSPIIAAHAIPGSQLYFDILKTLADRVKKSFLHYKVYCHPSIRDVRPLLECGWRIFPDYAHSWDLRNPEALLADLKGRKRFQQVKKAFQNLDFADERGKAIFDEFIPLYMETARQVGYKLRKSWPRVFRTIAIELLERGIIRFLTCRKKSGELIGVATYILDPLRNTAFGWQLAHIPLRGGEVDFIPALYIHSIKTLSGEVSFIDIGVGVRPSLYFFKDSLGTRSTPEFLAQTPNSKFWKQFRSIIHKVKQSLKPL
jgi:hypothetical protein